MKSVYCQQCATSIKETRSRGTEALSVAPSLVKQYNLLAAVIDPQFDPRETTPRVSFRPVKRRYFWSLNVFSWNTNSLNLSVCTGAKGTPKKKKSTSARGGALHITKHHGIISDVGSWTIPIGRYRSHRISSVAWGLNVAGPSPFCCTRGLKLHESLNSSLLFGSSV